MLDIFAKIEKAHFLATDADIEALAKDRQSAVERDGKASGTYLKVLVALTAHEIGTRTTPLARRRGRASKKVLPPLEVVDHLSAAERVIARCYAVVLRAVATPELAAAEGLSQEEANRRTLERNRRTNYARTAAYALRSFVASGGDARDLDLATVTKGMLREAAERNAPPSESVSVQRMERAAVRSAETVVKEAEQLAARDTVRALIVVHELMEKLQTIERRIQEGEYEEPKAA